MVLGWMVAVASVAVAPGCLLAPPPRDKPDAGPLPLALDPDRIIPIEQKVPLKRKATELVNLSIQNAVTGGSGRTKRYYWYVNFDESPSKFAVSNDAEFRLTGCSDGIQGKDPTSGTEATSVVEVLVTEGEIAVEQSGDQRFTKAGEPYLTQRWTLIVSGFPDCSTK